MSQQTPPLQQCCTLAQQLLPHAVSPVAQPEQTPLTQVWPGRQGVPHPLQLFGSFPRFTHTPPQHVCPQAHLLPHLPQRVG